MIIRDRADWPINPIDRTRDCDDGIDAGAAAASQTRRAG